MTIEMPSGEWRLNVIPNFVNENTSMGELNSANNLMSVLLLYKFELSAAVFLFYMYI